MHTYNTSQRYSTVRRRKKQPGSFTAQRTHKTWLYIQWFLVNWVHISHIISNTSDNSTSYCIPVKPVYLNTNIWYIWLLEYNVVLRVIQYAILLRGTQCLSSYRNCFHYCVIMMSTHNVCITSADNNTLITDTWNFWKRKGDTKYDVPLLC